MRKSSSVTRYSKPDVGTVEDEALPDVLVEVRAEVVRLHLPRHVVGVEVEGAEVLVDLVDWGEPLDRRRRAWQIWRRRAWQILSARGGAREEVRILQRDGARDEREAGGGGREVDLARGSAEEVDLARGAGGEGGSCSAARRREEEARHEGKMRGGLGFGLGRWARAFPHPPTHLCVF
jgi:hypothetical protein